MYENYAVSMFGFFITLILGLVLCGVLFFLFKKSRSQHYREVLVDMYVVGMIKKFAEEDKIDLLKEFSEYLKILKRGYYYTKSLDKVIEEELKEKIAKAAEEKIEKEKE